MARNPMPTPSADSYYNSNTDKNKKKKQNSGYVTNTVTPPPQPVHEVNRTSGTTNSTNSGVSAPKQTQIYEQPVPKPETPTQTNRYLSETSKYNPLSLNQNSHSAQNSAMDSIYNKTVSYDPVPTPQTQMKSNKPQQPKGYSYTETKPITNQYVNNAVNTYTAPKQQMYTSPKTYPSAPPKPYPLDPPKTDIGEYKTIGGYTNANPYVSKDRVADYGQNSYSVQLKSQEKNSYAGVKNQNAVDELWAKYGTQLMGKNEIVQTPKPTKTSDSQKHKIQTVKAGKSTINIRYDGSTIHYDSETAIDLFDFLDFLSGNYGPNNEMARNISQSGSTDLVIPDLVAKVQPKNNIENPVLSYDAMIRKPDSIYGINADEWIATAPENWENMYKDKWFYVVDNGRFYNKRIVPNIDGLKTAEKEILLEDPVKSAYLYANSKKLNNSKELATILRDKLYIHNPEESNVEKPYTAEEANLDGSKPNAFLHTMWSAFLAYDFGEEFAKEITTAHEMLDREQYVDDKMYSQPEISSDKNIGSYSVGKAYPTLQQHMEMDLHNNALGISIAKEIKQMTDAEVVKELEYYYQSGDDAEYFDEMYPELKDDRKRLMFIVCLKSVQYGDAAIIWDKYGN